MVPFPPGGSVDVLGRTVGAKMSENLGQAVVVELELVWVRVLGQALVRAREPRSALALMRPSVPALGLPLAWVCLGVPDLVQAPVRRSAQGPMHQLVWALEIGRAHV